MTCCLTSGCIVSDAVMLVCWLLSCFVMCVFGLNLVVWCGVAFYLWLAAYLTVVWVCWVCFLAGLLVCLVGCYGFVLMVVIWLAVCWLKPVRGLIFGFVWGFSGGGLLWWWWCVF